MLSRILPLATLALTLPFAVLATEPNIKPGMWSYETTTRILNAPMAMPEQTFNSEECVTLEDIQRGDAFLDDIGEECRASNVNIRRDGMSYTMTCRGPDGSEMEMRADMRFMSNRISGTMESEMETPMGPMKMQMQVEGRRTGDC